MVRIFCLITISNQIPGLLRPENFCYTRLTAADHLSPLQPMSLQLGPSLRTSPLISFLIGDVPRVRLFLSTGVFCECGDFHSQRHLGPHHRPLNRADYAERPPAWDVAIELLAEYRRLDALGSVQSVEAIPLWHFVRICVPDAGPCCRICRKGPFAE